MRIIGLTGSIACGKSTVSAFLSQHGFPVIDGDRISRDLTVAGSPAMEEIRRIFGPEVLYEDGSLNRRRLGRIIFSNDAARKQLDDLMAPFLLSETKAGIEKARAGDAVLCFLDMPLLFEKGYDRLCDSVWTVWLPQDLQMQRLMDRDGFTPEEAHRRINAVLSSDEKAARSNRVIDNSGSLEDTYTEISDYILEELFEAQKAVHSTPPESCYPSAAAFASPLSQPSGFQQASATAAPAPPVTMQRPGKSSHHSNRKSAWRMPIWLKSSLIVLSALVMIGFTSLMLMNAYLTRRQEDHISDQRHIDMQYPLSFRDLIEKYAAEYNLSPAYVAAIIRNESSFQTKAESGVGARGLMQLMPDTAEWIAGKLKVSGYAFERMYDPESNIRFGCWYLNYLSRLFLGDPVSVTAAYHAGQGQVKIWLSDPFLSADGYKISLSSLPDGPTKSYAERVIRDYGIYQEKHFTPYIIPSNPAGNVSNILRCCILRQQQYHHIYPVFENASGSSL